MTTPEKQGQPVFDPADWLARAEAYGYKLTLHPDFAGRLGLSIQMPLNGRPQDVEDPLYELNRAKSIQS